MDPMDTIGETFYPLIQHRLTFSKSPTNRTWTFSIGIASCPMDPMDTIGTTFYPVIQHRLTFSKSLTNRTWTFPSESVRVRWITSISRPLHIYTSDFPIEGKGERLESGRQYWTTLNSTQEENLKERKTGDSATEFFHEESADDSVLKKDS